MFSHLGYVAQTIGKAFTYAWSGSRLFYGEERSGRSGVPLSPGCSASTSVDLLGAVLTIGRCSSYQIQNEQSCSFKRGMGLNNQERKD